MNRYRVDVTVLPKEGVLDIQGKAVERTLHQSGYASVEDVRVGRFVRFVVRADDEEAASSVVGSIADDLLANGLIESYSYKLELLP